MVGCAAPNCSNNSRLGLHKFFRFPADRERREQWLINTGRVGWVPQPSNVLCNVHFDENQFESHRLDGQRKLKPFAVPTIFSTVGPNDGQINVESLEQHEPEVTFHKQIKIESVISLSRVARALNAASDVTQKRKADRPRSSSKKKSTIQQRRTSARLSVRGRRKWTNFYKVEYETNTQSKKIQNKLRNTCPKEVRVVVEKIPRRSAQRTSGKGPPEKKISQGTAKITPGKGPSNERTRRRRVQSTLGKGPSRERIPRRSEQSTSEEGASKEKIPRRSVRSTLEEGPSKDRIPRCSERSTSEKAPSKEKIPRRSVQSTLEEGPSKDRIPQPIVQSTSEESPSKEKPCEKRESSNMPSKKRSRGSTETRPKPRPRKILRIDDESEETQVSCGLENSQDDAAEGEKVRGNCVVCNNYVEHGTVLATLTNVSKERLHEKLNRLVTGQDAITVKKDGVLCSVCTRLLNYMDRIEVELSMLKTALINCMRKKRVLKQDSNSSSQNHHSSDGSSKIDVPPPLDLECTEEDREEKDSKETIPEDGEHVGESDNHVDINSPEPLNETKCERSEQPDPLSGAAISEESKTKTNDKEYKCKICLFKTSHKSVMIFHLRQHVKDKFRCDFCNSNIAEDSEHIKHMLALPPYLRHRKKVTRLPVHLKPEMPISNTNTDLVVKQDLSADSANINSMVLSDDVFKVETSDCETSSLHETNVNLLDNGNFRAKMSCNVEIQENMSVLNPKRTVVKKIICKTNKKLVI
ncbi:uncharacterized protein [Anabrus simplex]|uniref:uncharacterized protein isoform X2 n=1 Tax=Anabrus simplex TaxID=316456 RepID=UPI0035A36C54